MSNFAWVTLATNDSYSLGALVVANSLKKVNTAHQTAVLITPGVSESMKSKLQATFNVVVDVNVLDSKDAANLALLSRPELGVTFTKLHCWRLTQFEKCVFLDADTFVLQNCDELFDREELSAAPDVGWPDCFNSGVFVFRPSLDTFGKLIEFATRQGSFDGGDQGLLNSFFSDWAHKDISKHLPFIYNTCSTACYSYLPAFKQFGQNVKILHFIGQVKPWLLNFDSSSKTVYAPQGYGHLGEYLQQWWNLFCADVHPALTKEMGGLAGALAQLTLGAPRSAEQVAYEESMRRQCWEAGNIDYLGKDSFDNIWARITKTIETKNDTPTTEKNRSPTPQPEETLAVETKKEVQVGPTLNESEEDAVAAPAPIDEKIVTEVTPDGRIIEKKIVTYPGEEITEVEEIQEVDGQIVSVKRSVIGEETTAAQPKPKTLAEIKSEPIVLVPGHKTVEIDEKTNSTIVREKTTTGYQQTITTVQEDGTKKIQTKTFYDPVEIPGEEVEEETYEEIKTIEPGTEKTTVTTTTETTVASDGTLSNKDTVATSENQNVVEAEPTKPDENIEQKDEKASQDETKESKALTDLKNQPIVIVLGHQKVEFDKETNTTTVTEKTTTGYQQTLTTVTPDGRTIVQTKVFYDPISSEQVEEVETTTTTTVTEVSEAPITSEQVETVGTTTTVTEVSEAPISSEEVETVETTTVTEVSQAPISSEQVETVETTTTTTVTEVSEAPISSEQVETVETTTTVTDVSAVPTPNESISNNTDVTITESKDVQLAVAAPIGETSLIQKKTTADGKEIEVTAVVSEDGKTKTLRKTTRQPSEEIEIEEYEETQSYEPGEVKVITTKKTVPIVEALEDAAKEITTEQITTAAKLTTVEQKQTIATKQDTSVVKPTIASDKQITTEESQITTEATDSKTETKQTVDATKITTEAKETITQAKETTTEAKEAIAKAKKTVDGNKTTTEVKQATTAAKQTTAEAKEAITKVKEVVEANKTTTEAKQALNEAKKTTTEAMQTVSEAKQTVDAKKIKTEAKETTTEAKETTTGAKQTSSSVKKTITGGKQGAVETKQIKKEDQTEPSVKKVTKPSDKDTKKTTPTVTVKTTTTIVKKDVESPKKTKVATDKAATTESTIIGEPKVTTKDGETITETVRRIPGGTEHTWTTVRADGSTKTESKTCFDVVELSSDEEWEEYEEIIEDDTIPEKPVTTKPKAPVAAGVKAGPKTPTVTEATPPSTPPLKKLVIGSTSSALKAEHDIPDTPPLDKVEQLRKKKTSVCTCL